MKTPNNTIMVYSPNLEDFSFHTQSLFLGLHHSEHLILDHQSHYRHQIKVFQTRYRSNLAVVLQYSGFSTKVIRAAILE